MNKCLRCKVNIMDDAVMCPLCRGVLAQERETADALQGDEEGKGRNEEERYHSRVLMYPNVYPAIRRMQFIKRLVIFSSVVLESILLLINYLTYNGIKWSLVTGVGLVYACFTLVYSFEQNKSLQKKLVVQLVFALGAFVLIDATVGYRGWSISLAIPSAVMAVELTVIILMLVNHKNWQNYILTQIVLFLISLIMVLLGLLGITEANLLSIIAIAATGFLLLGTLVFGDKRAENELKRRFHM